MRNRRYFPLGGLEPLACAFVIFCLSAFAVSPAVSDVGQALPEQHIVVEEYHSAKSSGHCASARESSSELSEINNIDLMCFVFFNGGLPKHLSDGVVGMEYLWWVAPELAARRNGRIAVPLPANSFLKVGGGEWAPLQQAFSGKRHYLGAVRSFLHFRGDTDRIRPISA